MTGAKPPPPKRPTERDMLDLLHARLGREGGNGPRYVIAEHVRNSAGFGGVWTPGAPPQLRTCDALAIDLWPSAGNLIHGFEVKVSRADWRTELKDPSKAEAFRRYCDYWWLVVPDAKIAQGDLPPGWGLMAGTTALRIRRQAPRLAPEPIPRGMLAAWLRCAARTAERRVGPWEGAKESTLVT